MAFTACGKIVALETNLSLSVSFKIINEEIVKKYSGSIHFIKDKSTKLGYFILKQFVFNFSMTALFKLVLGI